MPSRRPVRECRCRLHWQHQCRGAGEGTRTLDPLLGKQMLYRLSYSRSIALEAFLLNQAVV